ncbi:alpha-1,2-mannosidase [Streptomyces atroolivaceus]|uniref:alpha-1,2-mannosidase n=1 Tax=Streptomyces atroolivaceus TaxID=66869 RepID=UPI0033C19624
MQPTFADFSVAPARVSNCGTAYEACHAGSSHLAMSAGARVTLEFEVDAEEEIGEATLKVTALVSKLGGSPGYAPVDLVVNEYPLVRGLTVPGGGDLPQDNVFAVPGRSLRPGTNTLEIRTADDARSMLWLYRVTLDSVYERGRSERAMAADAARNTVFAYTTERCEPFTWSWEPGPRLLFHVDRGEQSLPAQLGWRGADGAESAISFQSNMSDFHGHHRAADGTLAEFRGRIAGRWAFPEGTEDAHVHRFGTEEGWGGGWHSSGELRLLVDDGSGPVERVTWRDQRGNSGVAGLRIGPGGASSPADVTADASVVGASDEYVAAGEIAEHLLDSSQEKWLAGDARAWVEFRLERPVTLTSYTLTSANDFPQRDPRDWLLYGSTDGDRWTRLDSRAGEAFTRRFEARTFRITGAPAGPFTRYRLDITGNGGADEIQLSGVRFAGVGPVDFSGYYQRYNEGPIGYRGTAVNAPPSPAAHADSAAEAGKAAEAARLAEEAEQAARLAEELDRAARSLAEAARSMGKMAAWVRDR